MKQLYKPVLIVMAAGMGSRYGGLKQMDPVDEKGHLLIDYSIYDAVQAGFETVIFVIREENKDLFMEKIGNRISKKVHVEYAFQRVQDLPAGYPVPEGRTKPWGTGQAVLSAFFAANSSPFAVINADDFYGREAFQNLHGYLSTEADDKDLYRYSMVGYKLKNTVTDNGSVSRGVCSVSDAGELTGITERTRIEKRDGGISFSEDDGKTWQGMDPDTIVSMNMWGFNFSMMEELLARFPKFLDGALKNDPLKAEYYLPSVVGELIGEKKASVKVLTTEGQWYGMTYREDKPQVMAALKAMREKGIYPENLLDS